MAFDAGDLDLNAVVSDMEKMLRRLIGEPLPGECAARHHRSARRGGHRIG